MTRLAPRASYLCALVAMGLLALHFNAAQLPGWTRSLAVLAGGFAVAGAALAAMSLDRRGWVSIRRWPIQAAFALNTVLALGFLVYADTE
jgi:hypothetical protein